MTPKVSIVMPVRNAETTLAESLESCLGQTMEEFELLVVLNGCTDDSAAIAERMATADSHGRIRLSRNHPAGVAAAAQLGMSATRTSFVARMDADDIAHPDRLRLQYELLVGDESLTGVTGLVELLSPLGDGMVRYVDWVNGLKSPEDVARERFIECPLIQPSLMLRREAFFEVGGFGEVPWAEDHDLFLRMLERGARFGKVDELVLSWRDSEARLTRSHPAYAEEQVRMMKAHYLARLPEVQHRGVAISGAGPIGKRLARQLVSLGVQAHGYFEVNPRRIGETIGGLPVAGPEEFGTRWRQAVLLSAVGVEGGRCKVRALAESAGYLEGEDFWCCC